MRLSHKNSVAASFIWKEERHIHVLIENTDILCIMLPPVIRQ